MEPDKIDGYNVHARHELAFAINDQVSVPYFFGRYRAVIDGRCLVKVEFNNAEVQSAQEQLTDVMMSHVNLGDCVKITRKCGDGEIVVGIPYPLTDRDMLWYVTKALWLCLLDADEMCHMKVREREAREKEQA